MMKDINLFEGLHQERTIRRRDKWKQKLLIGVVFVTTISSISTIIYYSAATMIVNRNANAIVLDTQTYDEIMTLKDTIDSMEIRMTAYELLGRTEKVYEDTTILSLLGGTFPSDVSALNLTYEYDGKLAITGISNDVESIAYLISRLKANDIVANVFVSGITAPQVSVETLGTNTDAGQVTFALEIALK